MTAVESGALIDASELRGEIASRVEQGARFAVLFASALDRRTRLSCVVSWPDRYELVEALLAHGQRHYPALTVSVPSATWYEREIRDLFGVEPLDHPRLDPLVLPQREATRIIPGPGADGQHGGIAPDERALPAHITGHGVFTIPYGPVRSGVFEAVEYLIDTPGEDIPHLRTRIYHKHRGIERRFEGQSVEVGALLAERVEGVAGVAHAIAFCEAVERAAGVTPPTAARLARTLHAELERIANHLDVTVRLTEAAGLAVANARLALHKERVLRLVARLCGHRFGRHVVIPGGVRDGPALRSKELLEELDVLEGEIARDLRLLLVTPSFLDRVRATGYLPVHDALLLGALGPVGRGSGLLEDARLNHPYAAYDIVGFESPQPNTEGDALARLLVRCEEISASFHILRQVVDHLDRVSGGPWKASFPPHVDGRGIGWAEAPQGELIYCVELRDGVLARVKPRSASFHNLSLFHSVFRGDVLTDFAFIEASFGLSIAGAAG